ncbi:hypothetical protein [Calycomorphotria hydatis]|uniref:Plasmid stabilization system protein n=1 Tax=Calycomorphotria hydatis TaxID=2528027 RepID=A0A517T3A5_9PLAN|nr:hypothetical protein [Calycomorphotria hydatis]QDT62858.1 hypothetical protein V22_00560 [Calycomorphotria hydatis]
MKYFVNMLPAAEAELAKIWMDAVDRVVVTQTMDRLDQLLRLDPLAFGESREDLTRIGYIFPLGVLFLVHEEDLRVDIVHLWRID